jgi:hypothetical protein
VAVIHWKSNESVKLPAGALARHEQHGWVTVVAATGWTRIIESYRYDATHPSGSPERTPRRIVHAVDVRELRPLPNLNL